MESEFRIAVVTGHGSAIANNHMKVDLGTRDIAAGASVSASFMRAPKGTSTEPFDRCLSSVYLMKEAFLGGEFVAAAHSI